MPTRACNLSYNRNTVSPRSQNYDTLNLITEYIILLGARGARET